MRHLVLVVLPVLLAASGPAQLEPGLWAVQSAPGVATLAGKPLGDLPYNAPAAPDTICLTPAQASDPATWLAREAANGCVLTRRTVSGGRVDMAGRCAPQAAGLAGGTVRLTGRWTPTRYTLRFASFNPSENGVMGFTGTLTGHRVGACPG